MFINHTLTFCDNMPQHSKRDVIRWFWSCFNKILWFGCSYIYAKTALKYWRQILSSGERTDTFRKRPPSASWAPGGPRYRPPKPLRKRKTQRSRRKFNVSVGDPGSFEPSRRTEQNHMRFIIFDGVLQYYTLTGLLWWNEQTQSLSPPGGSIWEVALWKFSLNKLFKVAFMFTYYTKTVNITINTQNIYFHFNTACTQQKEAKILQMTLNM